EADAMIGEPVLREVVGADLLAAVTRAYLRFTRSGKFGVLPLLLNFIETRAQYAHALFAVFDLRFLVLATYYGVGWDVGDAYRRISGIDGLAAGTRRAEGVDAKVFGLDLDVDVFGFGQYGDGDCRSMHAALCFGCGNPLHA